MMYGYLVMIVLGDGRVAKEAHRCALTARADVGKDTRGQVVSTFSPTSVLTSASIARRVLLFSELIQGYIIIESI